MTRALRLVQRNALVYRRVWRGSLFGSFLQPTLFLAAMGYGLGSLVDRGGTALPGGVPYLTFLGPGLLASSCMQTASFEASFPITGKMTWRRNYEAIAATPVGIVDIVLGELAWIAVRVTVVATAFVAALLAFGAVSSPRVIAAIPAAVLTGLSFAAPIVAYAATLRPGGNFNAVFRFIVTPLFLFSGVFFPVVQLPRVMQWLASATPLYHGVELTRGITLGTLAPGAAVVHLLFLMAVTTVGALAAFRTFAARLRA